MQTSQYPSHPRRESGSDYAADLELALRLAEIADAASLPRFGASDLRVAAKPDMTPVSDADLAVERQLRAELARERPDDLVLGEEFAAGESGHGESDHGESGQGESDAGESDDGDVGSIPLQRATEGRTWVIDPIDGTKNFVRGVPIWATLIALLDNGIPVVGVVSAPALARRWWGSQGADANTRFADGPVRRCRVSAVSRIEDASLSLAQLISWEDIGLGGQMLDLSRRCWRTRGYGDFYSYMLVAEGAVDIAAEPELSLWDLAALAPIVISAGGRFTTHDGAEVTPFAASALATNGPLHEDVLAALRG